MQPHLMFDILWLTSSRLAVSGNIFGLYDVFAQKVFIFLIKLHHAYLNQPGQIYTSIFSSVNWNKKRREIGKERQVVLTNSHLPDSHSWSPFPCKSCAYSIQLLMRKPVLCLQNRVFVPKFVTTVTFMMMMMMKKIN